MSSTTSAAPSASSSSRAAIQVEIPASTVLAIGLGFVGLTFILLSVSLGTRLYRVRRRMIAVRATGQTLDFSTAWQREGGVFGFLSSLGSGALVVGAGGSAVDRGREILWGGTQPEKETPVIWDVPIREKAGELGAGDDLCEPFALSSTKSPRYIDRATPATELPQPRFVLSLLISLPRDPMATTADARGAHRESGEDEEDWPELPEVLVGTTQVCPMVFERAGDEGGEGDTRDKMKRDEDRKGESTPGAEVGRLDYVPSGGRPARWERYDVVKWRIEGMR